MTATLLPAPARPRSADARAPRLDSLTGMRFIAALAVFVHHTTGLAPGTGLAQAPVLFPYSTMGVNGVGFFFVLSGFLLAWGHRPGTRRGLFHWRRAGRIYLLHQTLNRCVQDTWGRMWPDNSALFTLCGLAVAVIALSWALFTYVEEPARKWWSRHTPRRLAR